MNFDFYSEKKIEFKKWKTSKFKTLWFNFSLWWPWKFLNLFQTNCTKNWRKCRFLFFAEDMAPENHFEIKIEYSKKTNGFQMDQETDFRAEVDRKLNSDWGWWPEVDRKWSYEYPKIRDPVTDQWIHVKQIES